MSKTEEWILCPLKSMEFCDYLFDGYCLGCELARDFFEPEGEVE